MVLVENPKIILESPIMVLENPKIFLEMPKKYPRKSQNGFKKSQFVLKSLKCPKWCDKTCWDTLYKCSLAAHSKAKKMHWNSICSSRKFYQFQLWTFATLSKLALKKTSKINPLIGPKRPKKLDFVMTVKKSAWVMMKSSPDNLSLSSFHAFFSPLEIAKKESLKKSLASWKMRQKTQK